MPLAGRLTVFLARTTRTTTSLTAIIVHRNIEELGGTLQIVAIGTPATNGKTANILNAAVIQISMVITMGMVYRVFSSYKITLTPRNHVESSGV